jgi:RimJ/RimL family protein N-acetyltransferase
MDHRLPVLMGRDVLLREPTPADAGRLFEHVSDPHVTRFLAFDPPRTVEDTLQFVARCEQYRREDREYVFVVASRATDEPLGVIGLRHVDLMLGTAQVGTWIRRADWGHGVNTEAKALLLDFAFDVLHLHRIEARIAVDNVRSRRAFEKLGAVYEAILRESFRKEGAVADQALYSLLEPEWRARGGAAAVLAALGESGVNG